MSVPPWVGRHQALPEEVRQALATDAPVRVLDVRTPAEFAARHIPNAMLVPLSDLPERSGMLDGEAAWVVVCQHGIRSSAATAWLLENGFPNACNMVGGMAHWDGPVETGPPRGA